MPVIKRKLHRSRRGIRGEEAPDMFDVVSIGLLVLALVCIVTVIVIAVY